MGLYLELFVEDLDALAGTADVEQERGAETVVVGEFVLEVAVQGGVEGRELLGGFVGEQELELPDLFVVLGDLQVELGDLVVELHIYKYNF